MDYTYVADIHTGRTAEDKAKGEPAMYDASQNQTETFTDNKIRPATGNGAVPRMGIHQNGAPPTNQVSTTANDEDDDLDEEARRKQKERREREPLLYCKLVARWPLRSFILTLCGHIMMIIISIILLASGYNLLPIDFENLPLEINDEPWRPRDVAFRYRDEYTGHYERISGASIYRSQTYIRSSIDLYYDGEGSNVFSKAVLEQIQANEDRLTAVSGYSSTYCKLDDNATACVEPVSIIRYFDGTYAAIDPVFNDPNFDNITGVVYEAYTNNLTKGAFQFFLGRGFSISQTSVYNAITRSKVLFGYPLKAYDSSDNYEKAARSFSADFMKPILNDIRKSSGLFTFSYRSDMLWIEDVFNQAIKDVMCAIGSICFIFIFILIHTRSLWITAFAVLSIITCFLCTNLIYVVVLDFRYLGFFHVLTIFIVLGIGADDVFVFYDVWRNTAYEPYPSLAHRLSDAYRKSVKSMFFTSLTTSVAFFASAISPLLATRSFGIFSGLVIIVNYISIILYFPTVVVMYHTKFEKFRWPCFKICKRKKDSPEQEASVTNVNNFGINNDPCVYIMDNNGPPITNDNFQTRYTNHEKTKLANGDPGHKSKQGSQLSIKEAEKSFQKPGSANGVISNGGLTNGYVNKGFEYDGDYTSHSKQEMQIKEEDNPYMHPKDRKRKSRVVNFFRHKYSAFVTHKIARWVVLAFTTAVLAFFISQAVKLEPDNEGLKVLKDSHVYSVAAKHATSSFVQSNSDRTLEIYIAWGFIENDLSDCHFSTPKCMGKQQWDSSFDPNTPEAQLAVKDFCDTMMNFAQATGDEYRLKTDYVTGDYKIDCYINSLATFLDAETASSGTNYSLPFTYSKAVNLMTNNPTYYNTTGFNSSYDNYLEIAISHWLSNKQTYVTTDDYTDYDPLIGEETGTYSRALNTDSTKLYGNNIKYVAIRVTTTMVVAKLGFTEGLPVLDRWEAFVKDEMNKMPAGMKNGMQLTFQIWHWLHVQKMLAENAVYGIVIGVCLAFPILTIATMNIITGFLATLSMCCSTVCVIGVIPLGGWKLGVLVSLNMCMVVGLTVDYVVHLAEGYTLSLHKRRLSRLQDMLDEMAISIFFGACTTLGASMFMFIAQLSFFFQFGIFMFSTILFSLFFSMLMFVTLMGLVGPENNTGNILVLCRRIRAKCKGEEHVVQ